MANGFAQRLDPGTFSLGTQASPFGGFALAIGAGSVWMAQQNPDAVLQVEPATGRTLHTVPMDGFVSDLTFGDGALWATGETTGDQPTAKAWRIDTRTFAVTEIVLPGQDVRTWSGAAVGEGAVWIPGTTHWDRKSNTGHDVLWKVNPKTNEVINSISVPTGYVASGGGSVWVASLNTLRRLDPRTGEVQHETDLDDLATDLTYGEGAVWAVDAQGIVYRVDPATGAITHRVGKPVANSAGHITTGVDVVWVADTVTGRLTKIKP